jgi:hypothetical protein
MHREVLVRWVGQYNSTIREIKLRGIFVIFKPMVQCLLVFT